MRIVSIFEAVGDFGEDKDTAAKIREDIIKPTLETGQTVEIDFAGVTLVTQSFIHALLSDALRVGGEEVLDRLDFKNCSTVVRGIISTVVQYSLDTMAD